MNVDNKTLTAMEAAVKTLIESVGDDPSREGLCDTPRRVAKAWLDMASGSGMDSGDCSKAFGAALFHEPILITGSEGLILVRDITFASLSEETLLPFHGKCHVAYIPHDGVILGLSKLARAARCLASRIQCPQKLAQDLMTAVDMEVTPKGVFVVVEAHQLGCFDQPLLVYGQDMCGCFSDSKGGAADEVLLLLGYGDGSILAKKPYALHQAAESLVAAMGMAKKENETDPATTQAMVRAIETLLRGVGEDPCRTELKGSALRYVSWLRHTTSGYHMSPPSSICSLLHGDLAPNTPEDVSLESSETSSDDMAMDSGPCYVHIHREHPHVALSMCDDGIDTFTAHFSSQCEHHLLPFYGTVKIAYTSFPSLIDSSNEIAKRSVEQCLEHIIRMFSLRLQVQERLTQQIAESASKALGCDNLLVVVESSHLCMVARGVEEHASTTLTTATRGRWSTEAALRRQALRKLID